jgi:hypothetical protein
MMMHVQLGLYTSQSRAEEIYEPMVDEPTIITNESTPYLFLAKVRGYVFDDGGENCSVTLQYGDKGYTNNTKELYKCKDAEESMEWSGDPIVLPLDDPDINNTVDERIETYAALYTSSGGSVQQTYINETMHIDYPNANPYWTFRYATKEWHDNQNNRHSYGDVYVRIYNWSADRWDMLWEETGSQEHTNAIKTDRSIPIQSTYINETNKIKISTELYIMPISFGQQGAWYYEGKIEYKENAFMTADEIEVTLEDLQRSTTYYYKFLITNSNSTTESSEESFTTLPTEPEVMTGNNTRYYDLATIWGKVTEDGGENCTVWFEYGIYPHLENTTTAIPGLFTNDTFNQTIYALQPNQEYTYRAAIQNSNGTYYGENKTFTTLDFLHVNETNTPYYLSLEHLELWGEMHFENIIIDENCTLSVTENSNIPLILNCSNNIYINGTINVSGHNGEGYYSGAGGGAVKIIADTIIINGGILADGGDAQQGPGDSNGIAGGYDGVPANTYGLGPGGGKHATDGTGGGGGYGTKGEKGQNYFPSEKSWGGITYGYADLRQWGVNSQNVTNPYSGVNYSQLVGGSSGAGEIMFPGAGSGGTIWLHAPEIILNGSLSAVGGVAERVTSYRHGGDGGDGRIRIDYLGTISEVNMTNIQPVPHKGLNISVNTVQKIGIGEENATLIGELSEDGDETCTAWFAWGRTDMYGNHSPYTLEPTGKNYSYELSGLSPGTLYHYRAEAQHINKTATGVDVIFLTYPYHPTTLSAIKESTYINISWEKGTGSYYTYVERNNDSTNWSRGEGVFVTNTTKTYWHDANATMVGTYHYQAWAQAEETDDTTLYAWSTLNDSVTVQIEEYMPIISNETPANNSFNIGGNPTISVNVSDKQGGLKIVRLFEEVGGAWVLRNEYTGSPLSNGTFTASTANVTKGNTTYNWSIYVEDMEGNNITQYKKFTTRVFQPTITLLETAPDIKEKTADLEVNLTTDGGETCTIWFEYGIAELTNTSESINATAGLCTKMISDLSPTTTYTYRAVCNNSNSTVYSQNGTFRTQSKPLLPILHTPQNNTVNAVTYGLIINCTLIDVDNESMNCTIYWGNHTPISTINNIENNSEAVFNLSQYITPPYLSHNTTYTWYLNISDDQTTTMSGTYAFKTRHAADFDGDQRITYIDASILAYHYGETCRAGIDPWDVNDDGIVTTFDVSIFVSGYGSV